MAKEYVIAAGIVVSMLLGNVLLKQHLDETRAAKLKTQIEQLDVEYERVTKLLK
jgi:hypothetical protein